MNDRSRPLVQAIVAVVTLLLFVVQAAEGQRGGASKRRGGSRLFWQMQATGKPALVIAGNEGCVHCRIMAEELASNVALRPFVEQMFVVKVDTDSQEWPLLREEFRFEETGIPAVFFVRADGELLHAESGRPSDLEAFLTARLGEAGNLLDAKSLAGMQRETRQLDRALKRKDWPVIVRLVKKWGGTGSYAASALQFDEAAAELTKKSLSDIAAAEAQLEDEALRLEGAMALMSASKLYAGYEPAERPLTAVIEKARQDDATAQLLRDAERLNEAVEQESRRRRSAAVKIYEQIIAERPDSAAASYAAERLKALQ